MSARTVYESAPLRGERGGTTVLRLLLSSAAARTEVRIDRQELLPHKALNSVVVRIDEPSAAVEPLARAMTTVVHELERLLLQGYWLRERAGGGWRGAWHTDLVAPRSTRAVLAWKTDLTKRPRELERLAASLARLDVPVARFDEPQDDAAALAAVMRRHGADVRRHHAIDALTAQDPMLPADELVEELDRRGLLVPPEEPGDTAEES